MSLVIKINPIIFSLFFLFLMKIQAQTTFFKIYETPYSDQVFDATELTDGNYLLVGERAFSYVEDTTFELIFKIGHDGIVVKDTMLGETGNISRADFIITYPNSDKYIVGGYTNHWNQDTILNAMTLHIINNNLDIVSHRSYFSAPDEAHLTWRPEIIFDSLLCILSLYCQPNSSTQIALTMIRLPFDSVRSYHSPAGIVHFPQDFIYIEKDSIFKVFYIGPLLQKTNPSKILTLDKDLEYLNTTEGPPSIVVSICATPYNDSSFLLTGAGRPGHENAKERIFVYQMTNDDDTLKSIEYFNNPDTILYAGGKTNTVVAHNGIYVVGMYNIDPATYPWQQTPTWIQLTKMDTNLNIISHHFYGGDAVYTPFSIIGTSDEGILIAGDRYDYNLPDDYKKSIFVIKTDSSGVIAGIDENRYSYTQDGILYPNPGNGFLISLLGIQYKEATLIIRDLTGKTVLETTIRDYKTEIETSFLPSGVYLYQFVSGGKCIGFGKWIKFD